MADQKVLEALDILCELVKDMSPEEVYELVKDVPNEKADQYALLEKMIMSRSL